MVDVDGVCRPGFAAVGEEFARNFAERGEIGGAVALTVDGETVVDLWGGDAVGDAGPWRRDTLVWVASTTKGMTALCAHILVDRGELDLDAPVARYWPEFAQAGKETLPVRWILSHRAGLVGPGKPVESLYDWDAVCAVLAESEPQYEPGTIMMYHSLTFGFLVGEVVRRISGQSLGTFLRSEVTEPLGADLFVGVPESEHHRCAGMVQPDRYGTVRPGDPGFGEAVPPELVRAYAAAGNLPGRGAGRPVTTPDWRSAEIPSGNGFMTARGLARVYAALANGGALDGVRIVGPDAVERMRELPPDIDLVVMNVDGRSTRGLGFVVNSAGRFGPNPLAFGHPGAGGSVGFCDPENRVSFGYVTSRMGDDIPGGDVRGPSLVDAAYRALGLA